MSSISSTCSLAFFFLLRVLGGLGWVGFEDVRSKLPPVLGRQQESDRKTAVDVNQRVRLLRQGVKIWDEQAINYSYQLYNFVTRWLRCLILCKWWIPRELKLLVACINCDHLDMTKAAVLLFWVDSELASNKLTQQWKHALIQQEIHLHAVGGFFFFQAAMFDLPGLRLLFSNPAKKKLDRHVADRQTSFIAQYYREIQTNENPRIFGPETSSFFTPENQSNPAAIHLCWVLLSLRKSELG